MPGREVSQGGCDLALHTQQVLPPHTPSTGVSQGGTDLPVHTEQVIPPHTPRTGVSQGGSDLAVYTQQLDPPQTPDVSNPNDVTINELEDGMDGIDVESAWDHSDMQESFVPRDEQNKG